MGDLSTHFDKEELICQHCGELHIEPDFLEMLDQARTLAGVAFKITSGYRCPKHNKEVGSTSSNHTSGRAADIACSLGADRIKIVRGLIEAGFQRIGIAKTFIHTDSMDKLGAPPSIWLY